MIGSDPAAVAGVNCGAGVLRHVWRFAAPYRGAIVGFLVVIVAASLLSLAPPLLFRQILDEAIPNADRSQLNRARGGSSWWPPWVDALLALVERYLSSRVGEGMIYDLRVSLFDHVQRRPMSFFTRAQTGALTSRMNSDVLGTQRAVTGTLASVVSNVVTLVANGRRHASSSTGASRCITLLLLPLFMCRPSASGDAPGPDPPADGPQRVHEHHDHRTVQRVRRLARQAVRPDRTTRRRASRPGPTECGRWGCARRSTAAPSSSRSGSSARSAAAAVYWIGGRCDLRHDHSGHARRAGRLRQPDLRPVDLPDQRPRRRHDGPRLVRAGVRGARRPEPDPRPARAPRPRRAPAESSSTPCRSPTRASGGRREPRGGGAAGRRWRTSRRHRSCTGSTAVIEPGQLVALVGPSGAGKTTLSQLVPRLYDVTHGAVRVDGVDVGTSRSESLRSAIGIVSQDAHLFHDTIGNNLRYARPDATDAEVVEAVPRRPHPGPDRRVPAATTPWSASGATGCPAARSNGSPSRAAAQGPRHRHPRRGHQPARLRDGAARAAGAGREPSPGAQPRDRPPPVDDQAADQHPRAGRGPAGRSGAPTTPSSAAGACTPTSIGSSCGRSSNARRGGCEP